MFKTWKSVGKKKKKKKKSLDTNASELTSLRMKLWVIPFLSVIFHLLIEYILQEKKTLRFCI